MFPYQNYTPMYQGNYQQMSMNNFIPVRSEAEAFSYPMELGKSYTFKNETAPYIYTKTMGPSPMDPPRFEKFKLVKEGGEDQEGQQYITKAELQTVKEQIETVISDLESLTDEVYVLKRKPAAKRKEVVENDA